MPSFNQNRRRTELRVESLEGKALLSTGTGMHHIAPDLRSARIIDQAPAPFSGTLTGLYSNIHIPFAGYLLNYATSGTLTGVGSTRLRGSLFVRGATSRAGRFAGKLALHNDGGSMIIRVFQTAVSGTDTYIVGRAGGIDSADRGDIGTLTITQSPTMSVPYYISGQATMTFS